ncbi:MAG: precorrin-2 dehydrogenase/sirohydrochlorin ferrochelatase family protein [Candidatus Methanospirareceae archaeon]
MMPLILDLSDKRVLIVGGGGVGGRKARLFSSFAKEIVIIGKDFSEDVKELARNEEKVYLKKIDMVEDFKAVEDLIKGSFLVITATNSKELNEEVARLAKHYGKLVNRADVSEEGDGEISGDVIVPSIIKKGDILVGISTCGRSPAMAKFLRQKIEGDIRVEHERMVKLQSELRKILKGKIKEQKEREKILDAVIKDEEIWAILRDSYEEAMKKAINRYCEPTFS